MRMARSGINALKAYKSWRLQIMRMHKLILVLARLRISRFMVFSVLVMNESNFRGASCFKYCVFIAHMTMPNLII